MATGRVSFIYDDPKFDLDKELQIISQKGMGNEPLFWLLKAYDLICTAYILKSEIKKRTKDDHGFCFILKGKNVPMAWHAIDPCYMIEGYFIEVLLKSDYVSRGKEIIDDAGNFIKIQGAKHHDFVQLSNVIGFKLSTDERKYLSILNKYTIAYGRYPVAKKIDPLNEKINLDDKLFLKISDRILSAINNDLLKRKSSLTENSINLCNKLIHRTRIILKKFV